MQSIIITGFKHHTVYILQMPVCDKITVVITKLLQDLEEKEGAAYYHMPVSQATVSDAVL